MKYKYRNLPCKARSGADMPYAVSGIDKKKNLAGILEWCHSQEDAENIIHCMNTDTDRFVGLFAEQQNKEK